MQPEPWVSVEEVGRPDGAADNLPKGHSQKEAAQPTDAKGYMIGPPTSRIRVTVVDGAPSSSTTDLG